MSHESCEAVMCNHDKLIIDGCIYSQSPTALQSLSSYQQ